MIHHPIILGSKAILLLILIVVLVVLHGLLPPEHFKTAVKIGIAAFIGGIFAIWSVFFMMLNNPNSRLSKSMVLTDASRDDADETARRRQTLAAMIGVQGIAETNLRPSGIGRFNDDLLDVVSDRTFIEKGRPIIITGIEGKKVTVKKGRD